MLFQEKFRKMFSYSFQERGQQGKQTSNLWGQENGQELEGFLKARFVIVLYSVFCHNKFVSFHRRAFFQYVQRYMYLTILSKKMYVYACNLFFALSVSKTF